MCGVQAVGGGERLLLGGVEMMDVSMRYELKIIIMRATRCESTYQIDIQIPCSLLSIDIDLLDPSQSPSQRSSSLNF